MFEGMGKGYGAGGRTLPPVASRGGTGDGGVPLRSALAAVRSWRMAAAADWSLALLLAGLGEAQLRWFTGCCGTGVARAGVGFALTALETLPLGSAAGRRSRSCC